MDSLDSLENSSVEDNKRNKTVPSQEQINQLLSEDSCSLALFVVQDLLDALNLSYTSAVFKSETGNISNKYLNKTKDDVLNELNLNLNSGEYKCSPEINGDTVNQSDNESSLNSSMKKFDKDQPILLQLLNNYKMSPNNSDIFNNQDNQVKMNVTTVISSNAEHKEWMWVYYVLVDLYFNETCTILARWRKISFKFLWKWMNDFSPSLETDESSNMYFNLCSLMVI